MTIQCKLTVFSLQFISMKQPHMLTERISLNCAPLWIKWSMATRGSYVHISMGYILGGIPIMLVLCRIFYETPLPWFQTKKMAQGFENSWQLLWTIPMLAANCFINSCIYQNYTLALSHIQGLQAQCTHCNLVLLLYICALPHHKMSTKKMGKGENGSVPPPPTIHHVEEFESQLTSV